MKNVTLTPLTPEDREQFILDNQRAFKFGATEEFGQCDAHFEEEGEIISRGTIEKSIDEGTAYRIRDDGHWYQLEYLLDRNRTVTSIRYRYIP